jgi:zinc protease
LLQTYQNFLKQGGTDEQLNAAKAGLIGSYELSNVTNQSILNNLITFVFYDYPVNYFETVGKKIEAVTEKEILSAFAPLQTRPLVTVAVGQSNVLETKGH